MPSFPEALLRPLRSLRGRRGAGLRAAPGRGDFPCFQPASALLPLCFRSASTLLPPFAPQAARARAAARGRLRALRAGGRSRLRRRAASPQGHMNGRRPGRASASALPPPPALSASAPAPPGAPFGWHAWHLRLWSLWSRPSISPQSQARYQRRAASTGVPPQRQGGGAALPCGALPVLRRLARSVRGRKPGRRVQVMPSCRRWGSNHGFAGVRITDFQTETCGSSHVPACFPTTSPFSDETLPSARRRRTYVLAV